MAGEVEAWEGATARLQELWEMQRKTSDLTERRDLQERIKIAEAEMKESADAIKAAAKRGDPEAMAFMESVTTLAARDGHDPAG